MLLFFLATFLILLSFYLLAKVCDDYFVPALEHISDRLNLPDDVAGATLMAVGSSAPELFISLFALLVGGGEHAHMGAGTIVGSALFNLLVIIGASAMVCQAALNWKVVSRDLFFYALSIVWLLLSFYDGLITPLEAWTFLGFYGLYLLVLVFWSRLPQDTSTQSLSEPTENQSDPSSNWMFQQVDTVLNGIFLKNNNHYVSFVISVILIAALSWLLVEQSVYVAHFLNIPEALIALTILAAGTSIPDLMSSLIVARKGKGAMSMSNAIGSNIFDIFVGLGLPWVLLMASQPKGIHVETDGLLSSAIFLLGSTLLIFGILLTQKWTISKATGYALLGTYGFYFAYALMDHYVF